MVDYNFILKNNKIIITDGNSKKMLEENIFTIINDVKN